MQDPKETFNNIEHNTEMALLQSEKIAESVDNLEPIMEGVLVKADDILNEQKKTNELLSKEEEPKPEVQKIELLGAELITIKGKDGENGDKGEKGDKGDTGERGEKGEQGERGDIGKQGEKGEKGDKGDTGKDGIDGLDGKDGKNGKNGKDGKNGSPDTPKQVKEKLLKVGLDYNEIDNTPDINKVINIAVAGVKQSSKTVSLVELDDIDYSGLSFVNGKYVLGGGSGYVPYTGATQDLNLGHNDLIIKADDDEFAIRVQDLAGNDHVTIGHGQFGDGFIQIYKNDDTVGTTIEGGVILTKTINLSGGAFTTATSVLSDGANVSIDASLGNIFTLTAAGNRTISPPTNAVNGQRITIYHKASGADRTLTLSTSAGGFIFGTDITALTATASGLTDLIGCEYNSTISKWLVVAYVKGFTI